MSENKVLRKCSRCHATKLQEYFGINTKGELFRLCNNCREKRKEKNEQTYEENKDKMKEYKRRSYEKFINKPLDEQYSICEKCGGRFHKLYEGKSRHLKRWPCVKSQMAGNPGKKEFFEWVLENRNNLIRDYQKYISKAEEYLSSQ